MALQDFLSDGAAIPAGSAFKSMTSQTVLPEWYTNYAQQLLSNQQALSQAPYTPYQGPRVADFTGAQQQGFQQASQAATAYQPALSQATNATQSLMGSSALSAAQPYFNAANSYNPVTAASGDYNSARSAIGAAQGINPTSTAGNYYSQAMNMNPAEIAAGNFTGAASAYNRAQGMSAASAAQPHFSSALAMDPMAAANPNYNAAQTAISQAQGMNALGTAQPYYGGALSYLEQSTNPTGIAMASPFLQGASGNVADVGSYMNPYTDSVVSRIADLGTRNLSDNIMPALEGRYISSGQFRGSGQMTDTARAIRDVSNDILGQQSTALQQGYNAAQSAKTSDLNRYAGLASTAGNLGLGQQNVVANAGRTIADMGTAAGGFTQAGQNAALTAAGQLASLGTNRANITQGQQALAQGIGSAMGNLTQADQAGALSAGNAQANLGTQRAGLTQAQQQLLSNIGTNMGSLAQGQQANNLSAAGALANLGTNAGTLAQGQQNFQASLGQNVGALVGADASRGLTAAQQLAGLGGLAQSYGLTGAGALSQVGGQQQQLNQQNLNIAYEDFLRQQGYPQAQIDAMLNTFKGTATGVPSMGQEYGIVPTGQPAEYKPSTASQIAAGLTGAAGLADVLKGIF